MKYAYRDRRLAIYIPPYRALNWQTGETVAIKQIALGNIPPSELPEIMVRATLTSSSRSRTRA